MLTTRTIIVDLILMLTSLAVSRSEPEMKVRLQDGFTKYEGRVEVFWNGTWGTICDDRWDRKDARVVCNQLGFGSPLQITNTAHFGTGSGPILLDNLECTGYEPEIFNCSHSGIGTHDCTHFEDAGVTCARPLRCLNSPCHHGVCVNSADSFYCLCPAGYMGKLCDQAVNCTLPDSAPPGAHFVSSQETYSYQDAVVVSCDDGPSSTSWTCNENGEWNSHYLPCASLSGAYKSAAVHSYTVIGIGSALVVIGVAVFIFAIFLLFRLKKRNRMESLYEISNLNLNQLNHEGIVSSAYLTMTGGNSSTPSPLRSDSQIGVDTVAAKAARAKMALPPTPTEKVKVWSPQSATSLCGMEADDRDGVVDGGGVTSPTPLLPAPTAVVASSSATASSKRHPPVPPVAPVRNKLKRLNPRENNYLGSKFPFPPPQPPNGVGATPIGGAASSITPNSANGKLLNSDQQKLLGRQESADDDELTSLMIYRNDVAARNHSHFNDELDATRNGKDTQASYNPYASI